LAEISNNNVEDHRHIRRTIDTISTEEHKVSHGSEEMKNMMKNVKMGLNVEEGTCRTIDEEVSPRTLTVI
jgi:hypothetical protein